MSAWKLVARELYEAGRPMASTEFLHVDRDALWRASRAGVVQQVSGSRKEHGSSEPATFVLTPRGREWCEGRATPTKKDEHGFVWVATWLKALPQGLRVQ